MVNGYFDRDGKPLSLDRVASKMEDPGYRVLAIEKVGGYRASTVWLGLDHRLPGLGDGAPLIFETTVFEGDGFHDRYCDRYATEEQALAGHAAVVAGLHDCTLELY